MATTTETEHKQIKASTMYLLAAAILVLTGGLIATMGLGGLILADRKSVV